MHRLFGLLYILLIMMPPMYGQTVVYETGFSPSDTAGWGEMSEFVPVATMTNSQMGWIINMGDTPTDNTGPAGAHEGSHYVYYEESCSPIAGGCPDNQFSLISPPIALNGTQSMLSFYSLLYGDDDTGGGTPSQLIVNILSDNGGTITPVLMETNGRDVDGTTWIEHVIDISNFDGETIRIEFLATEGGGIEGRGDIGIDTLRVTTIPKPIPALSEWGLILLLLVMINVAVVRMAYRGVERLDGIDC